MIARKLALSAIGLAALASTAHARVEPLAQGPDIPPAHLPALQLAQMDVEVYIDDYGRRILVNPRTGEVVGVVGEDVAPVGREPPIYDEPYFGDEPFAEEPYVDEWELREQQRRERRERRMRELGRAEPPPINQTVPVIPREPEYVEPRQLPAPVQQPQPQIVTVPPVERVPLSDPSAAPQSSVPMIEEASRIGETPPTGSTEIIETPAVEPGIAAEQPISGVSEDVAKIQILLDRVGTSPGVIDGRIGDNVNSAITAYRELTGRALRTYDPQSIEAALQESGGDAFTTYEITPVDAAGPFVASIPDDYAEKARMERMGYVSVVEMLAERFHMSEDYLRSLNPGIDFSRPGSRIQVANVARTERAPVARIVADKGKKQVRTFDAGGALVAVYPATIGSQSTPSPTGTHTVERIATDPEYTYNPNVNFKQGDNDQILTIPPGPNGPVGSVWIALSKPTYGIHGTPEPSKIGKTYSNGCIRLTNWDAQELAKLVKQGVTVEFVE